MLSLEYLRTQVGNYIDKPIVTQAVTSTHIHTQGWITRRHSATKFFPHQEPQNFKKEYALVYIQRKPTQGKPQYT